MELSTFLRNISLQHVRYLSCAILSLGLSGSIAAAAPPIEKKSAENPVYSPIHRTTLEMKKNSTTATASNNAFWPFGAEAGEMSCPTSISITITPPAYCTNTQGVLGVNVIGGTFTNPMYQWSTSNGRAAISNTTSATPDIDYITAGTTVISVTVTDGGICGSITASQSITISSTPEPIITISTTEVCQGNTINNITGSPAGSTRQWTVNNSSPGNPYGTFSAPSNQTSNFTANNPGNAEIFYQVTTTAGCTGISDPQPITIFAPVTATAAVQGSNQPNVCADATLTLAASATGGNGSYSYEWEYMGGTQVVPTFVNASILLNNVNAQNPVLTPVGTASDGDTYIFRVKATDGITCNDFSDNITITVRKITSAALSLTGASTICEAGTTTFKVDVTRGNSGGSPTYTLVYNDGTANITVNNYVSGSSITTNTQSADCSLSIVSITDARVTVSNCSSPSNGSSATVTVNNLSAGMVGADQTICSGDDVAAFTVGTAATGDGTLSYQWQISTNGGANWNDINGATGDIYNEGTLTADAQYRRITTSMLNSVACTATGNVITVAVNNLTAGVVGADQTICSGDDVAAFTVGTAATGDGALSYQWQISTDGGAMWNDINAATAATYDEGTLTADAQYRRITTSTLNSVACTATSNVIAVTVNNLTAGVVGADQTICSGDDVAAFTVGTAATGDGALSYEWEISTDGGATWNDIATGATYDEGTLTADAQYRRMTVSTLNSVVCTATGNVITVTVNNITPGVIAGDQTICTGQTASFTQTSAAAPDGAISYEWESSIDNGANWSIIPSATSATYTSGALTQTTQYRRKDISTLNSVDCNAYTNVLTVTVQTATAGVWYVNDATGNNANLGTENCPKKTIAAALTAATAGDIINVAAGTYTENVLITKTIQLRGANYGISASTETLRATRNAETIVNGAFSIGNVSNVANNVTIDGFKFIGSAVTFTDRTKIAVIKGLNAKIQNNIFDSELLPSSNYQVSGQSTFGITTGSGYDQTGLEVKDNYFVRLRSGVFSNPSLSTAQLYANNQFSSRTGINFDHFGTAAYFATVSNNNFVEVTIGSDIIGPVTAINCTALLSGSNMQFTGNTITSNFVDLDFKDIRSGATVNVSNNFFTKRPSAAGVTSHLWVRLLTGSSGVTVSNNSFTEMGSGRAIQNDGTGSINAATCNWYGTLNANTIASKVFGNVTYSPWLVNGTDDQPSTVGFQPVAGTCTGTAVTIASATVRNIWCGETTGSIDVAFSGGTGPYDIAWTGGSATGVTSIYTISDLAAGTYGITVTDANGSTDSDGGLLIQNLPVHNSTANTRYATIQEAITAATALDVIEICAGTYTQNVTINKSLDIRGANYGVDPNTDIRVAESIVSGTFLVQSSGISIDGFAITGNSFAVQAPGTGQSDIAIRNNHMYANTGGRTIEYWGTAQAAAGWIVSSNLIEDIRAIDATAITLFNITGLTVTDNVILHTNSGFNGRRGLNLDGCKEVIFSGNTVNMGLANPASDNSDGAFTKARYSLQLSATDRSVTDVSVYDNTLAGGYSGLITLGNGVYDDINISNNEMNNNVLGIRFQAGTNLPSGSQSNITIQGNNISTSSRGIYLQNGASGGGTPDPYTNISITNNSLLRNTDGSTLEVESNAVLPDGPVSATCNWYGTLNANIIASKVAGNVTYSPWLVDGTDNQPSTFGFQPVPASCTGTAPAISLASKQNISCFGGNNGAISITITDGTAPFSYSWTGPNSFTNTSDEDLAVLTEAGTYNLTITDANGSTATFTESITAPAAAVTASVANVDILCNGGTTGTITVSSPAGGYGTYETSINGTNWFAVTTGSPYTFNGLVAGLYNVQIRDAAETACVTDLDGAGNTEISQPAALTVDAVAASAVLSCNNGVTTTITATAAGGTGTYTYAWSPSGGTMATTDPVGVGSYTVVVTDENNCQVTSSAVTISNPTHPGDGIWYVNDNSLTGDVLTTAVGSDANIGTASCPFATINHAISQALSGDIIKVDAGTYTGTVDIGTKALTIQGANAGTAGNGTRVTESIVTGGTFGFSLNGSANVTIDGFSVVGTNAPSSRGIITGNANAVPGPVTLSNNIISNWTTGISLAGGAYAGWADEITITGNLLVNNGIGSTENATNLVIQNNSFNNGGIGLGGGASMAAAISGNNFYGITGTGRYFSIATGVPLFGGQDLDGVLTSNTFDKYAAVFSATGSWYSQAVFAQINPSVAAATAGALIKVSPGTFTENVSVSKRVNIDGAGSGSDPASNTVITAAAAGTSTIVYTAGGTDVSNRQVLKDVRVTGASGGTGNNNSGILISGGSMGYFSFDNVTATGNTGHGLVSNIAPATSTLTDVIITGSSFSGNGSAGIRTASHSVDGFSVTNSTMQNNTGLGLAFNPSDNTTAQIGNVTLNGVTFSGNNSTADLYAFRMLGNMSLTNVDFQGSAGTGQFGLYLLGDYVNQASAPAIGTVTLNDVTVTGTYTSAGISYLGYSDLAGVSMTDVVLTTSIPTANRGHLRLSGVAGTLNLGNTAFVTPGTTPPALDILLNSNFGAAGSISTVQVDATNATFDGSLGSAMTLSQLFAREDRIRHAIDGATDATGFVRVKAGEVFVTPNSFAAPSTTAPSVQRGIDAATAGDIVHVDAGTYNVPSNQTFGVNKALTLLGANYQVDPTAQPSLRNAESKIVVNHSSGRAMTISASNVSVEGFEFEVQNSRDAINVMPTLVAGGSVSVSNLNFSNNIFRSSTTATTQKNGIMFGENNTNANPSGTLDTANITNVTINGNLFDFTVFANSSRGIPMTSQFDWLNYSGFSITNNRFQMGAVNGNGIAGTAVPNRHMMTNYVITGNTFTGYAGIDLTKSSNPLIENNTFSSLNYRAMAVGSTNGGAVRDNTIDGTGAALSSGGQFYAYGIDLYGGTDFGTPANGPTGNNNGLIVERNVISNFTHPTESNPNFRAINVRGNAGTDLIIRNNAIDNVQNGVQFASTTTNAQTVEVNSITNASTAIRNNSTTASIDADCNWYGTFNGSAIAGKIIGTVDYSPWLINGTDDDLATIGFQPVSGACSATAVEVTLATQTNITGCFGDATGAIDISVTGGTGLGSYTYDWSNDGPDATDDDTEDLTGLTAGAYTVTVTDGIGTTGTFTVTITQPAAVAPVGTPSHVSCLGGNNGSISLSVTGGTGAYTYNWNGTPTGEGTATITGLTAGTYTVTVTDENSCTGTTEVIVNEPATAVSASITAQTNVSCNGGSNGSATVTASGGTSPYTYDWPGTPTGDGTVTASGLAADTYVVTVTDNNNCTTTASVTITEPSAMVLTIDAQTNVSCNGGNNGSIDLGVTGGAGSYTYDWSNDGAENPDNDSQDLTGLTAAMYTVTVTDANGCQATTSATITQPDVLSLTPSQMNVSCNGGNTGTATVTPAGGTTPYTYDWDGDPTGDGTGTITGLAVGTYMVTVTDNKGCTASATVTITEPGALDITSSPSAGTTSARCLTAAQVETQFNTWRNAGITFTGGAAPVVTTVNYKVTSTANNTNTVVYDGDMDTPPPADGGSTVVTWTVTDECGNTATVSATFTATNCMRISGDILWHRDNSGVDAVNVAMAGLGAVPGLSNVMGSYNVYSEQIGNFTVTPTKTLLVPANSPLSPALGFTVHDVQAIQAHVGSGTAMADPYQRVAANVVLGTSSTITTNHRLTSSDATALSQAINGSAAQQARLVWRFIPANPALTIPAGALRSYGFVPRNLAPSWSPAGYGTYKVDTTYSSLNGPLTEQDFVAVRVGDVVSTPTPLHNPGSDSRYAGSPLLWRVKNTALKAGETIEATFRAEQMTDLKGWQFGLHFDPSYLQVEDLTTTGALALDPEVNFGLYQADQGEIRSLWADAEKQSLKKGESVFTIRFKVLQGDAMLSDVLGLDNGVQQSFALSETLDEVAVLLAFDGTRAAQEPVLHQNTPNPFDKETRIRFELPEDSDIRLSIHDVNGRLITEINGFYNQGLHEVRFGRGELGSSSGLLYYTLRCGEYTATRKMVVIE